MYGAVRGLLSLASLDTGTAVFSVASLATGTDFSFRSFSVDSVMFL